MTTNDLMKPRYKVIAPWPGMESEPFHMGQIVTLIKHETDGWIHIPLKHIPGSYMGELFFTNYPHLFEPLPWWKDRAVEDMPEYVRVIETPDQKLLPGMVLKLTWLNEGWGRTDSGEVFPYTNCFEPADLSEYLDYINKKEGA